MTIALETTLRRSKETNVTRYTRSALAVSRFRLRPRLGFSIPLPLSGPRGITPAFGYGAPHPSARGTSTPLNNALLSAHYEPLRHPRTAWPGSHELSVDRVPHDHRWGFPCCVWSPVSACRRQYPGRTDGIVRSYSPIDCGLPRTYGGSTPALFFSRPAQRSLSLQPACLPSRLEQPSTPENSLSSTAAPIATGWSEPVPGRDFPAVDQRLSRRTQISE